MPIPLNLTFGVELECIICFDPAIFEPALKPADGILWTQESSPHLPRESKLSILFRQHVGDFLTRKGFPTYDVTSQEGDQKWTISNDTSIDIQDGPRAIDGYLECDIEIKSPALRFCAKALRRVEQVVRLIAREFDASVNTSCGLHVHVGNRKKGFPLQTLKNLCMLTTMFEHQLNSLHPAHRIGNHHAKGPSAVFRGQNPWDTLQKIQGCESKHKLVRLYANDEGLLDRRFAYNICPMVLGPHKTIEFRQHESTLEWSKIVNWIQVAGGIVEAMHEIDAFCLAQLISTCAFDHKFTITDLLPRLKMDELVPCYEGSLHTNERPEPIWVGGLTEGSKEARPRRVQRLERWDEMERRHRVERLAEFERLDQRQELERRRLLERQDEEVDAEKVASEEAVTAEPFTR